MLHFNTFIFFIVIFLINIAFPSYAAFSQPFRKDVYSLQEGQSNHHAVRSRLHAEFQKWKGVRYQLGGAGNGGIDCSALTQKLFLAALNKRLPRTTGEQIKLGRHVPITSLLPGDLVFFKPGGALRHVGVYLGNNQFIHASDKAGVTLSNLLSPFWKTRFETARRVDG